MKKIKMATISVACVILISAWASMSLATEPSKQEADDPHGCNQNQTREKPKGKISVGGTAQYDCPPDRMTIILKILTNDLESAKVAKDKAAVIIDEVIKALKKAELTEDDIVTTQYNIEPKYEWEKNEFGNSKKVFKGYFVTVTIKVTLKDFDKAGPVIDAAVDAGALVDSINFELSRAKRNELKTQVLADAAKDAKIKAEAIVTALDEELGDVKSIDVNDYSYQPRTFWKNVYLSGDGLAEGSAPPTQILPGDLTISGSVSIVFEIL
jgi:uncharacterized protein YggE